MSGHRHKYLCWAEKTELDQKALDLHNAVLDMRLRSTWKGMNTNKENILWVADFQTADTFVTKLYEEMLKKERYVDCLNRTEYVQGMKALDDGAKGMLTAKEQGKMESYHWLLETFQICKAKQQKYEAAWAAIRAFDAKYNTVTAAAKRAAVWPFQEHAFSAKKEADLGEIAQMRGLLAEMGGLCI